MSNLSLRRRLFAKIIDQTILVLYCTWTCSKIKTIELQEFTVNNITMHYAEAKYELHRALHKFFHTALLETQFEDIYSVIRSKYI